MPNASEAAWRRIASDIAARIGAGEWPVGEAIPSLARLHGVYPEVSPTTITKAIRHLRSVGLIEGRQGVAVYVARLPIESDVTGTQTKPDVRGILADHERRLAAVEQRLRDMGRPEN